MRPDICAHFISVIQDTHMTHHRIFRQNFIQKGLMILKNILSNIFVKAAAFALFVILSVTAVFSAMAAAVTLGQYDASPSDFKSNSFVQDIAYWEIWYNTTDYFANKLSNVGIDAYGGEDSSGAAFTAEISSNYSDDIYDPSVTNFYAEVIDQDGHIVMRSTDAVNDFSSYIPIGYFNWDAWFSISALDDYVKQKNAAALEKTETATATVTQNAATSTGSLSAFKDSYRQSPIHLLGPSDDPKYRIILCINTKLTADDKVKHAVQLWNTLYDYKKAYLPVAVVSGLLCIVLFVFLMTAAGRRKNPDEAVPDSRGNGLIALRGIDRIPFDLLSCGYKTVIGIVLGVTIDTGTSFSGRTSIYDHLPAVISLVTLAAVISSAAALSWCMTAAVRFKSKTLLRNNIIWIACAAVKNLILKMLNSVKSLWFCVIGIAVWAFINFMIEMIFAWDPSPRIFFLMIFNALCIVGLLYLLNQMRRLEQGVRNMANGDFDTKIDTQKMIGPFKHHGECLNSIGDGMTIAVEERMKSERMKTELITNVSHDIKTPLTSIVNYVDLLKKEELDNQTAVGYVEVLDRQATRLRKLIEDLIEASKASTGNMKVTKETLNICELITQSLGEYEERFAANHLNIVTNLPEEGILIRADGRLLWRVLDNLMNNISKYAMPGSRVYADVEKEGNATKFQLKNISREQLNVRSDELMERFVRGDSARTSEGSGLGLSIARSLTELMGGAFRLSVDGDLFKVTLTLPNAPAEKDSIRRNNLKEKLRKSADLS